MANSFDAVLLIAFGGPQGPDDIRPFLANVLRGRRVAPERIEEVAHHYERFGGISPLTELTRRQATALERTLATQGHRLPVYVGMRNWHPYLADALREMSRAGVRRAIGVIAAAHRSYSSCTQYKENLADAKRRLHEDGLPDVEVTFVDDWYLSPGFIAAHADGILQARERLPYEVRGAWQLIFTAHSIPVSMARQYPYVEGLMASCGAIAGEVARRLGSERERAWKLVYQSRSGRPEDPWLEPDVNDQLADSVADGVRAVVLSPVGFIADHVEVLYDLDVEAAATAQRLGLALARASAVNDHPQFIEALAERVIALQDRYAPGRPLPLIAHAGTPDLKVVPRPT